MSLHPILFTGATDFEMPSYAANWMTKLPNSTTYWQDCGPGGGGAEAGLSMVGWGVCVVGGGGLGVSLHE